MKIILLNILFFSAIFAQSGLIIMGGLNQSKQNIEEDAEGLEINYMNGYNLYVERSFGVARFGVGLNQRGVKLNQAVSDMGVTVSADGEQTLNYLTVHAIYLSIRNPRNNNCFWWYTAREWNRWRSKG